MSLCRYSAPDYEWAYAPAPPGGAAGWARLHRGDAHPQRSGHRGFLRRPVHTGDTRKGTKCHKFLLLESFITLIIFISLLLVKQLPAHPAPAVFSLLVQILSVRHERPLIYKPILAALVYVCN